MKRILIIVLLLTVFLVALFITFSHDISPVANDYTWNDVKGSPNASTNIVYQLCTIIPQTTSFDVLYDDPFTHTQEITKTWSEITHIRSLFDAADSYTSIFFYLPSMSVTNADVKQLIDITKLYSAYAKIKVKEGEYNKAISALTTINSFTRKSIPHSTRLLNSLVLLTCYKINLETAYDIVENYDCPVSIKQRITAIFTPLPLHDISIDKILIGEYLYNKSIFLKIINALSTSPNLLTSYIITPLILKKNKTIVEVRHRLDLALKYATNTPPNLTPYTSYVESYNSSPDYLNFFGWRLIQLRNDNVELIINSIIKLKIKTDLMVMEMHRHYGKPLILIDPYTSKPYRQDTSATNTAYYSPGQDLIFDTDDDIRLGDK